MGKSSTTATLGVQCRKELIAKIEARARAAGMTKSRFAALILEKWETDGEKPVSDADRALTVLKGVYPASLDRISTSTNPTTNKGASASQPTGRLPHQKAVHPKKSKKARLSTERTLIEKRDDAEIAYLKKSPQKRLSASLAAVASSDKRRRQGKPETLEDKF